MKKFTDALREAAARSPGERYRETHARIQQQQQASGRLHICPACGTKDYHLSHPACAVCLTGWDGTPPTQQQVIRTYTSRGFGASVDQQFQEDAALMLRAGWRVASQSAGGLTARGVLGQQKARQMTVIYER